MEDQVAQRRRKLDELRSRGIAPYPNDFNPDSQAADVIARCGDLDGEGLLRLDTSYSLAGRVMARRSFGKAAFLKIGDRSAPGWTPPESRAFDAWICPRRTG